MGRQKGQSKRTKGNLQPSNSGRAAAFLSETQGITGFESLSGNLGYVPILKSLEDDTDASVDAQFRVILSKLTKKDVTTKLKALNEFSEYCQSCEAGQAISILPYWPRIYNRLCESSDRRVREASHVAFKSLLSTVGKEIAPHLKNVMGLWWISRCDPYSPALMAANDAFSQAFPTEEKQVKVVLFCYQEILNTIYSYVFMNTKSQPSLNANDQKSLSATDREHNDERIITSSLNSFALFVNVLKLNKSNVISEINTELGKFLANQKFWKLSKHKSPSVRAAFYSTLSSMCVSNPDLLNDHLPYICKCVLNKLDDPHYQVCKVLWETSNNLTKVFPDWHTHVDIRKGFLPQLWNALKSGFHGNAKIVSPYVLPLIKQFPPSLAVLPVYQELFKCLQQGLENERTQKSAGETKAIVTTIVECMQFVLQQTIETCEDPDWNIIDLVIEKQLLPLLENSIQEKSYLTVPLHQLIVSTLQMFSNKALLSSSTANSFQKICVMIWDKCFLIGQAIVLQYEEKKIGPEKIKSLLGFLKIARGTGLNTNKKLKPYVQFAEPGFIPSKPKAITTQYQNKEYEEKLNTVVKNLILEIFKIDLQPANKVILLNKFLSTFSSVDLIKLVVQDLHVDYKSDDVALFFLENDIAHLIKLLTENDKDNTEAQESIPNLLYECLKICTKNAQPFLDNILNHPDKYNVDIKACIQLTQHLIDNAVACDVWYLDWFKTEENSFGKFLERLTNDYIENYAYTELLQTAMTSKCCDNSSSLLHPNSIISILVGLEKISTKLDAGFLVKINSICFSTFSNYSSNLSFIKETKPILISLLTHLLTVVSDMEVGLEGLQQILNTLLNIEDAVMEVQDILMSCAHTLRTILLSSVSFNINLVTTFLTELLDQSLDFVVQWFNAFIPDQTSWLSYRPSKTASTWFDTQSVVNCDVICFDNKVLSSDHEAKPEYLNMSVCLTQLISSIENLVSTSNPEVLVQLLDLDKVKILFVEYFLAKANSPNMNSTSNMWYLNYTHFVKILAADIVRQSASIGHGWCLCFNEVLQDVGTKQVSEVFLQEIVTEKTTLTEALCNTLITFVNFCEDPEILSKVLEWTTNMVLECQSQFMENLEDESNSVKFNDYSLCLFLLSKLLEKINLLDPDALVIICSEVVKNLLELRSSSGNKVFLFDVDLSQSDNSMILFNVFLTKFLQSVLVFRPQIFEKEGWDFTQICLVSYLESLSHTPSISTWQQLTFLNATCSLMVALSGYLSSTEAINDPLLPSSLTNEWKEFFEPAAHSELVYIFVQLRDHTHNAIDVILPTLKKCFINIATETLVSVSTRLTPYLVPDSQISDAVQSLIYNFSVMLVPGPNGSSDRQVIAYNLLKKIKEVVYKKDGSEDYIFDIKIPLKLKDIVQLLTSAMDEIITFVPSKKQHVKTKPSDVDSSSEENTDSDEELPLSPAPLSPVHEHLPTPENIGAAIGYMFAWRLILGLLQHIPSNRRSGYISTFNDASFLSIQNTLLPKLVKLLPKIPLFFKTNNEGKTRKLNMFETNLEVEGSKADFLTVQHLACLLYNDLLKNTPAIVRTWFNNLTKLARAEIDDYTSAYVTPGLCKKELSIVSQAKHSEGLLVKARPSTREVVATYEVSDADFEISVHLSLNHPLTPVQVNTVRRIGVAASQWRYWILQMTMLLQHQNGSILDALLLWKEKVDKRLDGLEECMICFSVVHGSNTQSLPKLECKTCHKKYHAECLYKWFDTSNQSTCPLCRTPMMFK